MGLLGLRVPGAMVEDVDLEAGAVSPHAESSDQDSQEVNQVGSLPMSTMPLTPMILCRPLGSSQAVNSDLNSITHVKTTVTPLPAVIVDVFINGGCARLRAAYVACVSDRIIGLRSAAVRPLNEEAQTVGPGSQSPGFGSIVPLLNLLMNLVTILMLVLLLLLMVLLVTMILV